MKLKDQCVSLELAKKLKSVGIKQNSLFKYVAYENLYCGFISEEKVPDDHWTLHYHTDRCLTKCPGDWEISAFTVAELGEMIPPNIKNYDFEVLNMRHSDKPKSWRVRYISLANLSYKVLEEFCLFKEADARAKMLIYLIENGYLKVEDL